MKPLIFGLSLLICPLLATADPAPDPMDAIVVAYEAYVRSVNPEEAAREDGTEARQWRDVRPDVLAAHATVAQDLLARIDAAETSRTVDKAILKRLLRGDLDDVKYDSARIPFTGDWGFQAEPVFAAMETKLTTQAEAEAWIARLNDVPRYFTENIENMRRGVATGWTAHVDPLTTMSDQIREQLVSDPADSDFYKPFLTLPEDMAPDVADRLRAEGLAAVSHALLAYADTLRFLETEYAPHARAGAGIADLPGGREAYAAYVEHHTAGAGYTPVEIHELGEREVARIRAEMEAIIDEIGFEGSFADFLVFLRTDPQFYATSAEDLMARAKAVAARMDAILPVYFGHLPKLAYDVEPVPLAIAPGYTTGRYVEGDPAEGRHGIYWVNTYALEQRPLYELPALTAHEAVPGHHLQIALSQEMSDQPKFRQDYYATAFGEGWGLYAEHLAGEAGLYETPYERFGGLSMEMWRACRLVADTGLHWYGWTRDEAETCFKDNTALAQLNIDNEVTRYIGWPGQAVAYKVGELKIRELRAEAEAALGAQFDIRAFHDAVLEEGAVPLDVLDSHIKSWVAGQLPEAPAAP
ncbi:DUF885 domain-containing protein [Hyphomonas johnsonii]|uniref:Lipoprotein n=1 Tax=Hyphomonas johnsonii MHS-2 TaxID=1280950 RepID=A0A059FM65_9PROT|nr:DUF885 domain-containing protein [Hyphomonas johnsonii]KCZ91611.1 hypothetical protein HJO_10857 [Hyphomonas johnsonii MHS-2]